MKKSAGALTMASNRDLTELSALEQKIMLVILRQHPNAYGISIMDKLHEDTGKMYQVGSVYAALERLEEKGFVKSRQGEATAERGGKRKLHFILTGVGQSSLEAAMNSWDVLRKGLKLKGVTKHGHYR